LQRIQDMSGGEDLYNGESNHQSNTQFSREEVNEYIRSVERDLQVRDGSRSSSRTTTGTSVNAAVAKTISDAEAASRSSSDENNECTTGSCPSRKRTEVPANADQSLRKEESTTIEEVKSEPVKKEPAFVLDPAVYSTYIQKMLPNYASESLSQLTVEKLTFRNLLEAGKAYTQLTTDHPGMAACIKQKGNQAMAQLEENYPVIHQSELEEQQRLSAQIAKAEAKLTKIKDPKKQEKERKAAMAKIWKSFDEQKLVDYYLGAGVDADQILMRATPDLESLIDSVEGCIADEKKAVGAQS